MKNTDKKTVFAEYHGAIVEVIEKQSFFSLVKIKGGQMYRARNNEIKPTTAKKTSLPKWMTPGAVLFDCSTSNGHFDIITLEEVGRTQYTAQGTRYLWSGPLAHLLEYCRPLSSFDLSATIQDAPADYSRLLEITAEELQPNKAHLFEIMTAANAAGAHELAATAHALMMGNTTDPAKVSEVVAETLTALQAAAEDAAENIEYDRDKAADLTDEPNADNKELNQYAAAWHIEQARKTYAEEFAPAVERLRSFVALFSPATTTDDPAQCAMTFDTTETAETPEDPQQKFFGSNTDTPNKNFLESFTAGWTEMYKKMVFAIVEYITKEPEQYNSKNEISVSFGWDGRGLSPVSRVAFVRKYGEKMTAEAEADARAIIEADRLFNKNANFNKYTLQATRRNPSELPEIGFYFTVCSGLKNEGGGIEKTVEDMLYMLNEYSDSDKWTDHPRLSRIIDVIHVTPEEFKNPATPDNLVKLYAENGVEFAGGACTDDPAPILGEEYRYYYTVAAAVVCPELGQWYAIDAEGYDYARYILAPVNWRDMYAENVAEWENEQKRKEEEKQRAIEAEQAAEVAEVEKWRGILETPPAITASYSNSAIYGKQKTAYQNAIKRNVAKIIKHYFPNVCNLKIKLSGEWYKEKFDIYWTDGATVAEMREITEIYNFVSMKYVSDPYADYGDYVSRDKKKLWRDTYGGTLGHLTPSAVDFVRTLSENAEQEAETLAKNYLPEYDEKQPYSNTAANFSDFFKFCEALGIERDDIHASNCGRCISRDDTTGAEVWSIYNTTINKLLRDNYRPQQPEPTPDPTPDKGGSTTEGDKCKFAGCTIIRYSEKAVAVVGNTRPFAAELKAAGGRFNFRLSCGAGWIFPASKREILSI